MLLIILYTSKKFITPKEQEANKKLRAELKKRNKNGNHYQIKNGKMVQRKIITFTVPPCTDNYHLDHLHNYCVPSRDPPNSNFLKVISLNCCSLRSLGKRAALKAMVDEHKPDLIMGCETHLDETYTNSEVFPQGYSIIRKDVMEGRGISSSIPKHFISRFINNY